MELREYQKDALSKMHNGCILCGGVGSGKSLTALAYAKLKGYLDVYIITTARKRDTNEWKSDIQKHGGFEGYAFNIDSWNNIKKYVNVKDAFFIFDEQRVIGHGEWVKCFLQITKKNKWILLSATPGDSWEEYIPVFIANGFYKNRTDFLHEHAVFSKFSKYPKIEKYIDEGLLIFYKDKILVPMNFHRKTTQHHINVFCDYDVTKYRYVMRNRWDIFNNKPIEQISSLCYALRRIVNDNDNKSREVEKIQKLHNRLIIFYNFDYELERLKKIPYLKNTVIAEWNGHKHESIPTSKRWVYLVQYTAGAEGWNCTDTDTIVFFSPNYSYKVMVQSAGRIDRLNTSFTDLFYYHIKTKSIIDIAINSALSKKKNFNEKSLIKKRGK
jgi:superfamily II DNA or RNA helicase|nr:MAG TPA: Chromatin remodeling complex ATPase [Caudoviricetes sp.]